MRVLAGTFSFRPEEAMVAVANEVARFELLLRSSRQPPDTLERAAHILGKAREAFGPDGALQGVLPAASVSALTFQKYLRVVTSLLANVAG